MSRPKTSRAAADSARDPHVVVISLPGGDGGDAIKNEGPPQTSRPPAVAPGARFGRWTVLRIDSVGKRALARCGCGEVRQPAVSALRDGSVMRGCGSCSSSLEPTFAAHAAAASALAARRRHRGRSEYWTLFVFAEDAQAELMRLAAGDRLSGQGRLQVDTYIGRDGAARINRSVVADHILALRHPRRQREPPPLQAEPPDGADNFEGAWPGPPR